MVGGHQAFEGAKRLTELTVGVARMEGSDWLEFQAGFRGGFNWLASYTLHTEPWPRLPTLDLDDDNDDDDYHYYHHHYYIFHRSPVAFVVTYSN